MTPGIGDGDREEPGAPNQGYPPVQPPAVPPQGWGGEPPAPQHPAFGSPAPAPAPGAPYGFVPPDHFNQPYPTAAPPYYGPHEPYPRAANPYATPSGQQRPSRRGFVGWLTGILIAIWAYAKYAVAFGLKFGVIKTALTLLVSFGAYAWWRGPAFAAALVVMILVHEMGHVVEIRRQGMQATAPLFIPFLGAAIFQRSHPTDALHQALIGIAGPISGTLGATVSLILFRITGMDFFLLAAFIGFFLNLFNLIPFGMLDGGWILSAASKWAQLLGLALLAGAVFFIGFSPIILLLVFLGIPTMIERFRNDRLPYYQAVPAGSRLALAGAWLALVIYLGYMFEQASVLARIPQVS